MRRTLLPLPLLVALGLPAVAGAQAQAPDDPVPATPSVATPPLIAAGFAVSPRALVTGRRTRVMFRIGGGDGSRTRVRVDLVPAAGGAPVAQLDAGRRRTGRLITLRWKLTVPAGRYVARLSATGARGATLLRTGGGVTTVPLTVKASPIRRPADAPATPPGASTVPVPAATPAPVLAPAIPAPAPAPVAGSRFPVRGAYTFGGADARFGAGRPGHIHQGQDVVAASGTPLVSPGPGVVFERKVQAGGAGHYLVIRSDAGPDWVFMHLVAGSETVAKGDRVAAGQQIGQVGSTRASSGPHLHFELWPNGWYAKGSSPIDPLPTLKAWAAAAG